MRKYKRRSIYRMRNYKNDQQKNFIGRLIDRSSGKLEADNDRSFDRSLLRFAVVLTVAQPARAGHKHRHSVKPLYCRERA